MAASSVRDVIVKDDDLVVGTHGRGIWILDDITPLRQIDAAVGGRDAVLFKPQTAWRVRWNTNTDMPLPPEEPTAPNPPDGAIINYYLKSRVERAGHARDLQQRWQRCVRRYSSTDPVAPIADPATAPCPLYWYRPPQPLSTAAGMHRFTWDVHYQPLAGLTSRRRRARRGPTQLPIQAIPYNTVAGADDAVGEPGHLHREADGRRQELHAADRREDRIRV